MWPMVLVALGGGIGSMARYGMGRMMLHRLGPAFPWGTLAVNVLGSFLIGLCVHFLPRDHHLRLLVVTGFLGGFTTFSAFSLDAMTLLKSNPFYGVVYIGLSMLLSIGAVFLGAKIHV